MPGSILLLYLEQEEPQVNVLGGQQLVALHRVDDGQRHIVCLIALIGEDKVVDNRTDRSRIPSGEESPALRNDIRDRVITQYLGN